MNEWADPIRAPDLAELETLVACAAAGSFAGASARLRISRPAVAKRIRNLEAIVGRPLLHRGPAGVRLTNAGVTVLDSARRILCERDALLEVVKTIRSPGESDSGLKRLLSVANGAVHPEKLAEARLADSERLLQLLLDTTNTAVVIANLDTGLIHEANDAFCRFAGRAREDLVGERALAQPEWYASPQRAELVEELRTNGVLEGVVSRMERPDGTTRIALSTTYLISVAGENVLMGIIEDVTDQTPGDVIHDKQTPPVRRDAAAPYSGTAGHERQ